MLRPWILFFGYLRVGEHYVAVDRRSPDSEEHGVSLVRVLLLAVRCFPFVSEPVLTLLVQHRDHDATPVGILG